MATSSPMPFFGDSGMTPEQLKKAMASFSITTTTTTGNSIVPPQTYGFQPFDDNNEEQFEAGDIVHCNGAGICAIVTKETHHHDPNIVMVETQDPNWGWEKDKEIPPDYKPIFTNKYRYAHITDFKMVTKKKKTPPKPPKFDLKELDPLVVAPEVLDEIKAVLRQQQNAKKMFEDWGLGEVIEYGRGMTFLFHGPPGTGKTWAATCIAKVFGREILSIGAAEIQTSEPGGANRNIQDAFKTAKQQNKILLLDECDSLITSRANLGMILAGEINTLLTEIEKYEGVVILATNRIEHLDEALERRISLIIEFPEPDFAQRQAIWERLLPKKMPLEKIVTAAKLAEYKLTGGQIKNVVIQAARLALSEDSKVVKASHFEAAIERVHKSKSLLGTASSYHQAIVRDIRKD